MSRLPSLAVRNVGRNKRRTAVTGLAIVFGVTAVIVLRAFTFGVQSMMTEDVVKGRGGALQVHKKGYVESIESSPLSLNMPHTKELMAKLSAVPHVAAVSGRIQFTGLVGNGRTQTMVVGRGVDIEADRATCPRADAVVKAGEPLSASDETHALVGIELAQSFDVAPGQTVNVQTSSPEGRSNSMDLTVRGLTISTLPFENKRVITVPLKTAQALLGLEGRVTEYVVAVDDSNAIDRTAEALQAALGDEYEVHTWRQLQPFVRDLINRQNVVLGGLATVLFLIVLTGIINTMMMSVFERVREIGTMLAIGVKRAQVMRLFLLEAVVIGFIGGVVGALVGSLLVAVFAIRGVPMPVSGIGTSSQLYPAVTAVFRISAVVVAVAGALVASAWPAWRASRLKPVDALRNA